MITPRLLSALSLVCLSVVAVEAQPRPAPAKPRPVRPFVEHGFITLNATAQASAADLTDRVLFNTNAETGTIDARYPGKTAMLADVTAGFRVTGRLGIALGGSRASSSGSASVSADIPHPFFDNQHRQVEGTATGVSRTEIAAHLQLYYDLRPKGPWRIRVFAGPSYFDVEQEVITEIDAAETFPYDTASFRSAGTARAKGSGIGFNGGADIARMFTRRFGAGVLIRYARGRVDLDAPESRSVSTDGGGLQAGGGIRVLF